MIKACDFKIKEEIQYWSDVSEEARDFVTKILVSDPDKRLTIDQIQIHPWM